PTAGERRLERGEAAGAGLRDPAPGERGWEGRSDRIVDDVTRVGLIGHPQRDAQVRVRAQVVLAHPGRTPGGHDQVDDQGRASPANRTATRSFVFARGLSLIAPARRLVAMIRWRPMLRAGWAMSTTPATNSGTSPASAAISSITSTSRGGHSGSCHCYSSIRY